mgnify:CR=1 FL=1
MSPTALLIVQALLTYGPTLARELQSLFAQQRDPTQEEWDKLFALYDKSYADYIAAATARRMASL